MKRYISLLLVFIFIFSLFGCSNPGNNPGPAIQNDTEKANSTVENGTQPQDATLSSEPEVTTEPPIATGDLLITISKLTFSIVGESEDIYCGSLPRDVILWESADETVAIVDSGVVTAVGVGTTTVTAQYRDQFVECTIGCLANDQEELESLPKEILHEPKKIPPVGDGQPCHFYDDAGIIGDSVSYSLVLWASQNGEMGSATFLVRGGNGILGYVNRYCTLSFQGQEVSIEEAVQLSGVKKVFIMLGVNDLGFMNVADTMTAFRTMVERILEKSPDVEIYIESLLPVWDEGIQGAKNVAVDEFNGLLEQYAEENNFHYVEGASYIKDHTGGMAEAYCTDFSTHMNYDGIDAWMQALKLYAKTQSFEEN